VSKQRGRFEGDVAVQELRERMALSPDLPPEPPLRDTGSVFGMVGRLAALVTVAAAGAYGFVWISTPRDQPDMRGFALAAYDNPAAPDGPGTPAALDGTSAANGSLTPAVFQPPPVPLAGQRADAPRLRDQAPPVARPQLLAPVPWPATENPDLIGKSREVPTTTTGVAARSAAPDEDDGAPPRRAMPAVTETPRASSAAASSRIGPEETATLLARGRTYLANGDVAAARLAFRRAAEGGDAQAALALGGTYDPLVLRSLGAVGVPADLAQARTWYQRAADLGARDAPQRLQQLAQSPR
jgi:hypothetical protein